MQILEQGGGAALEGAVADELRDPGGAEDAQGDLVRGVWRDGREVLEVGGGAQQDGGHEGAGHGLEQDVEDGVVGGHQGAEVEVEVGDGKPGGERDESGRVGALHHV